MASDEARRKALEQIQRIIDRQASNSFKIKGWAVALIVAALVFRSEDLHLFVAFIPLVGFWYLDSYYLRQERKFRELYDSVRTNGDGDESELFDMSTKEYDDCVKSTLELMAATPVLWFYGSILVLLIVYVIAYFEF